MAQVKPFCALRFTEKGGDIAQLVCPPYDIISADERKAYLAANEHNIIRLELPREGENPYEQAGMTLREWLQEGVLRCDDRPCLYIYEEEFTSAGERYKVKGFVCRVKLEEFEKGIILPHEETLSKAKADRFNLMQATGCNFSQIYSLYNDEKGTTTRRLNALSGEGVKPDIEFTGTDGIIQRLWVVSDPAAISEICGDFEERRLYIADGHHRYETALNYRNHQRQAGVSGDGHEYCMMMLVNMENDGLVVYPTHRIVRGLSGFDSERVLAQCEDYFDIERGIGSGDVEARLRGVYDAEKKGFAMYEDGRYTLLTLKDTGLMGRIMPGSSRGLRELDVSVLHSLVLERIFGIDKQNMANQTNLVYTRSAREACEAVDGGSADCCFILNPTRVSEIQSVAAAGEKMPQKSTYFYPKLITGLVMNKI